MKNIPMKCKGHELTTLDPISRKGTCSLCGEVPVCIAASRKGTSYWRCSFANGIKKVSLRGREHSLLEIDEATATGVCKTCGKIKIFRAGKINGKQQWRCFTAIKKTAKPRTTDMAPKEHILSQVDEEARTAVCAKCGPVKIISRGSEWKGKKYWRCATAVITNPKRPEYRRKASLKSLYGLTPEDYNRMLLEQNGACFLCGDRHDVLSVDHEHATGHNRKLLCRKCNTGLGAFKDSPDLLHRAASYIIDHGSLGREKYRAMYDGQGGKCAICSQKRPFLTLDFPFESSEENPLPVRGLLCDPCKSSLNACGDSKDSLLSAISYLQNHAASSIPA